VIFIIRHGQTELNSRMLLQGRSDHPLNETGRQQASEAGRLLRREGIVFTRVYSSPLIRAVQTAELVAPGAEIVTDERLLEMDYGPYEGTDLSHPPEEVLTFFRDFIHNPAPEGMEPLAHVVERAADFMKDLEGMEGDLLISTHAIAMKGILEALTEESNGGYWNTYVGNCEVYCTEWKNGTFTVPKPMFPQGN